VKFIKWKKVLYAIQMELEHTCWTLGSITSILWTTDHEEEAKKLKIFCFVIPVTDNSRPLQE
jgi:hypothetical protein